MENARGLGGFIRGFAQMFMGNRDFYSTYGWKPAITYSDMLNKYSRQDIANRIVNMPADALWTDPPTITGDDEIQAAITDLADRCNLWAKLNRTDKLAGMGPYATLLIGLDDGLALDQPVGTRKNKVIFLQPLSSQSMKIDAYQIDPTNERFGLPLYYNMNLQRNVAGVNAVLAQIIKNGTNRVHWSRVVHILENPLEDNVNGYPRMARCFNTMDDILKVGGGSAEVYWLNSRGGLHIDVDKEMDLQEDDADDFANEIDDYTNNQRRVLRTRGVKIEPINHTGIDPRQTFEVLVDLLAASESIPQRMLFGSEAGQLASEQDRANWATFIESRRKLFGEAVVLFALVSQLSFMGVISKGKILRAGMCVWPDAFKMNPLERSQTSAQQARSAANLLKCVPYQEPKTQQGADGQLVVLPALPTPLLSADEARKIIMSADPTVMQGSAPALPAAVASPEPPVGSLTQPGSGG